MPDDELRNAVHAIVSRLQADMEAQLTRIEQRHLEAREALRTEELEAREALRKEEIEARETLRQEVETRTRAETADAIAKEWAGKLEQAGREAEERLRVELAEATVLADQRVAAEKARLVAEAEQAASELAIRYQQEREQAVLEATAKVREQTGAELARARQELDRTQQEAQVRIAELERLVQEHEQGARELAQSFQELERSVQERERAAAESVVRLQAEIEQAGSRQRDEHQSLLAGERNRWTSEIEAERQKVTSMSAALEEAQSALASERLARESAQALLAEAASRQQRAVVEEAVGARVEERQAKVALVEQLMTAVRSVSEARSLSDTLNALAGAASSLAPRAALFIVNERSGNRELQGWRATGFADPSPAMLHLPADDGSLLATAASSRQTVSTSTVSAPDFAALPADRAGLAVPLTVGGKTVAVLYADDGAPGDAEAPASWPEATQILGAHASVCLSHITAVRTTQAMRATTGGTARAGDANSEEDHSARRYARLLVSEIKLYNEAAVRAGREERDLLSRLAPEIERARRLYEERIPASIGARARYFQEELVHTLADGDAALLGSV